MNEAPLPDGPLIAWYGDDFTGTAAAMEVMSFAGLASTMFLDPPTPAQLRRFGQLRGIGIAGTARSEGPDWMARELPHIFRALQATGAALLHYKICSTLDSAPEIGSIGAAMEVAARTLGPGVMPIYPAAVPMGRWQAFGSLFAATPEGVFRLDRHPVMSRHPVTPMHEADVARHLGAQTGIPIATLRLDHLHAGQADAQLRALMDQGAQGLSMDSVSLADQTEIGRMLWQNRARIPVSFGSQGIEYALVSWLQAAGLIATVPPPGSAGDLGPIAVVSGSVSPITALQIEHARANGFAVLGVAPGDLAAEDAGRAIETARADMLAARARGQDVILATALGPDDPGVARYASRLGELGLAPATANRRVGQALGTILREVVVASGLKRAVISGGDTSGHAARRLGVAALEALAPTIPGASIAIARAEDPAIDGLQLALKGGQMGSADFFSWVRAGGGLRQ